MENINTNSKTKQYHSPDTRCAFWLGLGAICLGVLLNPSTVEFLFSSDRSIDSFFVRTVIYALEAILISAGVYLAVRRPPISLINTILVGGASLLSVLLAIVVIQLIYVPPRIVSGFRAIGIEPLELNQLGQRGHPIEYTDQDFVVLMLGDSQVENGSCAYDYMPERRLEHHLRLVNENVKVFSVGSGGYGQDQELLALKEYYARYRADLVVLWETPRNDVWNNIFPTHWPTNGNPKPTFWLENGELQGPTEQIGEELALPRLKLFTLFPGLMYKFTHRDTLWEARLPPAYVPMTEYDGPVNTAWQKRWDADIGLMRYDNLKTDKNHFTIQLTPRSPRMQYGIDLTQKLLRKIEDLVIANNGRLITFYVSTPSFRSRPDEEVFALNGKYYRVSKKQFEQNMKDINRGLDMRIINVTLEKWRVGPTNGHLNEYANDEAMMILANKLKPFIPKP